MSEECSAGPATNSTTSNYWWSDPVRSAVHERLEWWLAKVGKNIMTCRSIAVQAGGLGFPELQEAIYSAGEAVGVYLSRQQVPHSSHLRRDEAYC